VGLFVNLIEDLLIKGEENMNFNVEFPFDVIGISFSAAAWLIVILWIYRTIKKKQMKLKIWKVVVITLIGIFSFSINCSILGTFVKFPLLPLGVWILYGLYFGRKDAWMNYRVFAWIGFFANFVFLIAALVSPLVHSMIFPNNEPTTYISNAEKASIIKIHSSGVYQTINGNKLHKQMDILENVKNYSDKWYEETYSGEIPKEELFPYLLLGVLPKWGSGIQSVIYIEKDGKGILIDTPQKQLYFRSKEAFLEGGSY
jgi:hypothetical protein